MKLRIIIFFILLNSAIARGQSYDAGFAKYTMSDFKGAIASLQSALPRTRSPKEKAKIFKLRGICEYMLNQKSKASESFKSAIANDSATTISGDEVLDESVISFFNAQKANSQRTASQTRTPPPPAGKAAPRYGTKVNTTRIILRSNVNGAQVLLDGIIAGTTNNPIETQPGSLVATINAKGYMSRAIRINVAPKKDNVYIVNLEKPKPKIIPPAPKRTEPAVAARTRPSTTAKANAPAGTKLPPPNVDDMFLTEETDIASLPSAGGSYPPPNQGYPQQSAPQGYTQQPYGAPPQGGYYAAPPQAYGQPAYPYGAQPYGAPYALPPQYAQPYMQPYQQPYAPQPYPQQQQGYQNPPPPPPAPTYDAPAPIDYGRGKGTDDFTPPSSQKSAPIARQQPSKPRPLALGNSRPQTTSMTKTSSSADQSTKTMIALIPFGAGQFYNGQTILGAVFGGAEVFALYSWYNENKIADDNTAEAKAYLNNPEETAKRTPEENEAYKKDAEAYSAEHRKTAQYWLYGFVGMWAAGSIQAILFTPDPPRAAPRPGLRRYSQSSLELQASAPLAPQPVEWRWGLIWNEQNNVPEAGFGLKVRVDL